MPRPAVERRSGDRPFIRLAVEFDGLVEHFGRLNPDAAGLLARIAALQATAIGPRPALRVEIARFGAGSSEGIAADWAALGVSRSAGQPPPALAHYREAAACAARADEAGVMVFAGRPHVVAELLAAGIPAWEVSDRDPRDHRQLAIAEAPRVVAEAVRLPVPRVMSDAALAGAIIAVRVGGAAEARDRGAALLARDLRADWLVLGSEQIVFCPLPDVAADLAARPGARWLAEQVRRDAVSLAPANVRAMGTVLAECNGLRLGALDGDGVIGWSAIRRTHQATMTRQWRSQPPLPGWAARGTEAADVGSARTGGDVHWGLAWPHANLESDAIVAVVISERPPRADSVERLAERCGGAAVLVLAGAGDAEALVEQGLWQAERNNLLAIVDMREPAGAEPLPRSTRTLPCVPVIAVRDGDGLAAVADRLPAPMAAIRR